MNGTDHNLQSVGEKDSVEHRVTYRVLLADFARCAWRDSAHSTPIPRATPRSVCVSKSQAKNAPTNAPTRVATRVGTASIHGF